LEKEIAFDVMVNICDFLMQGNVFYMLAIKKLFQSSPAFGMTLLMTFKMKEGILLYTADIGNTCILMMEICSLL